MDLATLCKWDHLRVCGADWLNESVGPNVSGSPPRVRSRLRSGRLRRGWNGITSACAEQTNWWNLETGDLRDHLRVCGADSDVLADALGVKGSPPRVRSRQLYFTVF